VFHTRAHTQYRQYMLVLLCLPHRDLCQEEEKKGPPPTRQLVLLAGLPGVGADVVWAVLVHTFSETLASSSSSIVVIDGIPRTLEDAKQISSVLLQLFTEVCILLLCAPNDILVSRCIEQGLRRRHKAPRDSQPPRGDICSRR
jgi:hypothetical protein